MALPLNEVEIPSLWLLCVISPVVSEEKIFINVVNVFLVFCHHLTVEKGRAFFKNKLEFLSSKYALCQVWLNLAQLFWRRR